MNIVIVGQGAIGKLWHAHSHVSQSKNKSTHFFLANSNRQRLKQYTFTFHQGQSQQINVSYADKHIISCADIILLCVKSYQVKQAVTDIYSVINKNTLIVLCHNGMGTLQELPKNVKNKHTILSMLTTHGCLQKSPQHAIHTGLGSSEIGLISGKLSGNVHQQITQTLHSILPKVEWHQDIVKAQWKKLAINCVINPLTAIYNIANGEISDKKYVSEINHILAEVVEAAQSQGINLLLSELKEKVLQVALATSQNSSSMRCDVLANKSTEIDYINGFIHKLGVEKGINTPLNTQLWQRVKSLSAQS